MTPDKSAGAPASRKEPIKERVFTLAPVTLKALALGVFVNGSNPQYEVTSDPTLDELLVVSINKEPIPKDPHHYMLLYVIENYSKAPCEVTVRYVGRGDTAKS